MTAFPRIHSAGLRLSGVAFVAAFALLAASGCGKRYIYHPTSEFAPMPRPAERELPIYTTVAPRDGLPIGLVQSRVCGEKTYANLAKQLEDVRRGALAANADAVIELHLLPVAHRGWVEDPQTPFPSWKQGRWVEYVLRGTAVVFPDREEALRGGPDAVAPDATESAPADKAVADELMATEPTPAAVPKGAAG